MQELPNFAAELGITNKSRLFEIIFSTKVFLPKTNRELTTALVIYSTNPNIKLSDVLATKNVFHIDDITSETSLSTFKFVGFEPKTENWGHVDRTSAQWEKLTGGDSGFEKIELTDLNFGWFQFQADLNMLYTIAFAKVDVVQEAFPNSVFSPEPLKIDTADQLDIYFPTKIGPHVKSCKKFTDGKPQWIAINTIEQSDIDCIDFFATGASDYGNLLHAIIQVANDPFASTVIVLNPFFLTSVTATFLMYAIVISLIISWQLGSIALSKLGPIFDIFEKAPLSSSFLLLGFIIALFASA